MTGGGLWAPERRALTVGLVLTITLVAFESLAVATILPEVKADLGHLALYGWVFSAFFLANLVGIVVAGQLADRVGLSLPFGLGLVLFAGGLVAGGAAPTMAILVAARVAQGLGGGAIPAVTYAAIGRAYPPASRPRMFATISTAWVVPGLVGPAAAAGIAHLWSWRAVFLGLLPFVLVAAMSALPALHRLGPPVGDDGQAPVPDPAGDRRRLRLVLALVAGVGAVLAAADRSAVVGAGLAVVGLPLAVWAFAGLVPDGTLQLRPGVPATVAVRGILTWAFFGTDAYVSLAVVDGRGSSTFLAGAALSAGSIAWATASWVQARLLDRVGPRRLDQVGFLVVAGGIGAMLAVALGAPVALAVPAWAFGAFGMGLAYSPLSVTVLAAARPGEEGSASAALQLSDTLGIAVGTGVSGALVAVGEARGWTVSASVTVVFAVSAAVALLGALASSRLPERVPTGA